MRNALIVTLILGLSACSGAGTDEAGTDTARAGPPVVDGAVYEADPQPYDPALDADAAIDAALNKARAENKLVLVSMGGNWCPDCRVLSGMMAVDGLDDLIARRFEVVKVDVGRPRADGGYERNAQIAERFGVPDFEGVPTLLIVTPAGKLLNADEPSIFRNARDRNPQDLADYLYRYAEQTPQAG